MPTQFTRNDARQFLKRLQRLCYDYDVEIGGLGTGVFNADGQDVLQGVEATPTGAQGIYWHPRTPEHGPTPQALKVGTFRDQ